MIFDRAGMPKQDYDGLATVLPRARVLAWGAGADGLVAAGTVGHLAVRTQGEWHLTPWHDVVSARWDDDAGRLEWASVSGPQVLPLTTPGKLPALVKDRVEASLVLDDRLVAAGVPVVISARRDLTDAAAPLLWRVSGADKDQLARPAVRDEVERRLADLRSELGR